MTGDDTITATGTVGGSGSVPGTDQNSSVTKTWKDGGCTSTNMKKKGKTKAANNCDPPKKKKKKGKKSKKKKNSDKCGGVAVMMLTYLGDGTNRVVMVTTKGTAVPGSPFTVSKNSTFTIDATGLSKGKLESSTIVSIMSGDSVDIHTSCSKPINLGDIHGDFKITGLTLLP